MDEDEEIILRLKYPPNVVDYLKIIEHYMKVFDDTEWHNGPLGRRGSGPDSRETEECRKTEI
jgi:hypothetical protein